MFGFQSFTKEQAIAEGHCKFVVVDSVLRLFSQERQHAHAVKEGETATDAGYIVIRKDCIILEDGYSMTLRVSCTEVGERLLSEFFGLPVRGRWE